ncbi:capsule polysaccharide biosynthesis protein [Diplodia corticola]|uniref:Capsule polysaccharide biosynthesis protein n=1 Tax=Diplodia corticola TaxID=236234 RepID=A0A1J9S211_9PEZI|nr:capsule polysaccharide biosynthesis protein [Diplodia corticola]OJD33685.1 capsule polysaccharide biosynthesis protein [Diplodia corticola]
MHIPIPDRSPNARNGDADPPRTPTDDEISRQLLAYAAPTDSTKNVWAFWHSGYASMPAWCRRNVINWVRRLGPTWTVRVLDSIPGSPTNASRFVGPDLLPRGAFAAATTPSGSKHAGVHAGDAVRLPLLQLYGGAWMDVGTILIRHLDDVWDVLDDASTPYELAAMTMPLRGRGEAETAMNGFLVVARRANAFVTRWHRIYLGLWADGDAADATGFHRHRLLRHLLLYTPSRLFAVSPEAFTDYVAHMLCAERLRDLRCRDDGFDGRRYYENNVFLLPSFREMFRLQEWSGWDGEKEFDVLSTRLDDVANPRVTSHARDLAHDLLENSVVIKLSHGPKGGSATTWLADLWDDPRHCHADDEPGTLAAYLRESILSYDHKRRLVPAKVGTLEAPVREAGLLEPCGTVVG